MTFMIVTHDQDEAMVVADRMAVMREGRIEQVGAPAPSLRPSGQPLRGAVHRRRRTCSRAGIDAAAADLLRLRASGGE